VAPIDCTLQSSTTNSRHQDWSRHLGAPQPLGGDPSSIARAIVDRTQEQGLLGQLDPNSPIFALQRHGCHRRPHAGTRHLLLAPSPTGPSSASHSSVDQEEAPCDVARINITARPAWPRSGLEGARSGQGAHTRRPCHPRPPHPPHPQALPPII
jgi:hypothetical protein